MATAKQKLAVSKMAENGGNVSRAMLEAGYTPVTAATPKKLTTSKGFQELADQYLPDNMLLEALKEDIESKKGNRKAELELAFKIKGKGGTEPAVGDIYNLTIQQNNFDPNKPEQRDIVDMTLETLMSKTKRSNIMGDINEQS